MYIQLIKRASDFIISVISFIIILPVILIIAILLLIANNGKVFFTQERPGKNSKSFFVVKFKTMNDRHDQTGKLLPDHQRLTKVGKFIRTTSLDELPQLINVIKGDMSLVGPRPLLVKYLPLYSLEEARRHEVKPGITGWAQVNGRNAISWHEKFELDVWYVDHLSFLLDVKIIWMTILKVFKREGISQQGQATVEAFRGAGEVETD